MTTNPKKDHKIEKKAEKAPESPPKKEENSELTKVKTELEQMTELAKRTMADMINLRRRQEEEKSTWIKMANIDLVKAILPVIDNFERAKKHAPALPETAKEWHQGIEMATNQLNQIMKDFGLEEIPTVGQKFNPELHEALMQAPGEKDIILEEFEKGFKVGDRIVKHAKVKVGNGE